MSIPEINNYYNKRVLQEKPQVYQLYFCLGVINYYFKEDLNQAKLDFMKFTELSKDNYPEETDIANKLIDEIKIKINDTNS
jgi:hypothetical protein